MSSIEWCEDPMYFHETEETPESSPLKSTDAMFSTDEDTDLELSPQPESTLHISPPKESPFFTLDKLEKAATEEVGSSRNKVSRYDGSIDAKAVTTDKEKQGRKRKASRNLELTDLAEDAQPLRRSKGPRSKRTTIPEQDQMWSYRANYMRNLRRREQQRIYDAKREVANPKRRRQKTEDEKDQDYVGKKEKPTEIEDEAETTPFVPFTALPPLPEVPPATALLQQMAPKPEESKAMKIEKEEEEVKEVAHSHGTRVATTQRVRFERTHPKPPPAGLRLVLGVQSAMNFTVLKSATWLGKPVDKPLQYRSLSELIDHALS